MVSPLIKTGWEVETWLTKSIRFFLSLALDFPLKLPPIDYLFKSHEAYMWPGLYGGASHEPRLLGPGPIGPLRVWERIKVS